MAAILYINEAANALILQKPPNDDELMVGEAGEPCCCVFMPCCDLGDPLIGEITEKTGDAADLPDDIDLPRDGGPGTYRWVSETVASPCDVASPTWGLTLECSGDVWVLTGVGFAIEYTLVAGNCETGEIEFDVSFETADGCTGTFHIYIHP